MATSAKNDFASLAEEKFDFDLPLSPASANGDAEEEDEVFVGPVGHLEKCISIGIEKKLTEGSSGSSGPLVSLELGSWSPLTGDRFEQIIHEAQLLAKKIGKNEGEGPAVEGVETKPATASLSAATEVFAEDSGAKLSALERPPDPALSPIKRETFCVQDSPLKKLPPAIQQRLLKAGGLNSPSASNIAVRSRSPVQASRPTGSLRGKAALTGGRGLLPSKPAVPGVSQRPKTKLPPPDTRLPPPDTGRSRQGHSPLSRTLSSAGSSEDLLSDVSMDSLNTSLPEKRLLPGPRKPPAMKPVAGRRMTESRRNTSSSSSSMSSLNSSVSASPAGKGSFNTSLSSGISNTKLKVPSSGNRPPGSGTATSAKSRTSSIGIRAAEPAKGGRPSPTGQAKRPAEPAKADPHKKRNATSQNLTPAKRPPQRVGSVPNISALNTATAKAVNPKPKSFVAPTPMGQAKGPRRSEVASPDSARSMKPKKLPSAGSVESALQKPGLPAPEGHQPPPAVRKSISVLPRPSSSLPTPVNRRVSGIPVMTPKSVRPGQAGERSALTASARKISQGSPVHLKVVARPSNLGPGPVSSETAPAGDDSPSGATLRPCSLAFCLDDDPGDVSSSGAAAETPEGNSQYVMEPQDGHNSQGCDVPDCDAEIRDAPESSIESQETPDSVKQCQETPELSFDTKGTPESHSDSKEISESSIESRLTHESGLENQNASISCTENPKTPESNREKENFITEQQIPRLQDGTAKTAEIKEVLLVDAPAPVLKPEEKLLIDLSNTPDVIKTAPMKPTGGQLIDLSSPLITWSPVDKKENIPDSPPPLINLSF
ncbi:hypothetical protein GJAV_G00270750 [Gymnothorax javanicus]|nr:hypothetical protein GJAV_G00270750 [Gymnothorax javanicus]